MAIVTIGKVRPTIEGNFDPLIPYDELCIVVYDEKVYLSKKPVPEGNYPNPNNSEYWLLVSGTKILEGGGTGSKIENIFIDASGDLHILYADETETVIPNFADMFKFDETYKLNSFGKYTIALDTLVSKETSRMFLDIADDLDRDKSTLPQHITDYFYSTESSLEFFFRSVVAEDGISAMQFIFFEPNKSLVQGVEYPTAWFRVLKQEYNAAALDALENPSEAWNEWIPLDSYSTNINNGGSALAQLVLNEDGDIIAEYADGTSSVVGNIESWLPYLPAGTGEGGDKTNLFKVPNASRLPMNLDELYEKPEQLVLVPREHLDSDANVPSVLFQDGYLVYTPIMLEVLIAENESTAIQIMYVKPDMWYDEGLGKTYPTTATIYKRHRDLTDYFNPNWTDWIAVDLDMSFLESYVLPRSNDGFLQDLVTNFFYTKQEINNLFDDKFLYGDRDSGDKGLSYIWESSGLDKEIHSTRKYVRTNIIQYGVPDLEVCDYFLEVETNFLEDNIIQTLSPVSKTYPNPNEKLERKGYRINTFEGDTITIPFSVQGYDNWEEVDYWDEPDTFELYVTIPDQQSNMPQLVTDFDGNQSISIWSDNQKNTRNKCMIELNINAERWNAVQLNFVNPDSQDEEPIAYADSYGYKNGTVDFETEWYDNDKDIAVNFKIVGFQTSGLYIVLLCEINVEYFYEYEWTKWIDVNAPNSLIPVINDAYHEGSIINLDNITESMQLVIADGHSTNGVPRWINRSYPFLFESIVSIDKQALFQRISGKYFDDNMNYSGLVYRYGQSKAIEDEDTGDNTLLLFTISFYGTPNTTNTSDGTFFQDYDPTIVHLDNITCYFNSNSQLFFTPTHLSDTSPVTFYKTYSNTEIISGVLRFPSAYFKMKTDGGITEGKIVSVQDSVDPVTGIFTNKVYTLFTVNFDTGVFTFNNTNINIEAYYEKDDGSGDSATKTIGYFNIINASYNAGEDVICDFSVTIIDPLNIEEYENMEIVYSVQWDKWQVPIVLDYEDSQGW
jgi:hypothetical protein